ncbi:MAG: hypothetical protein A2751_04680 [Candidatus Doudnabacteria bacterium RIFCSPHIGHO2_01_FULL_46_14]|uniref:Uncharacterized protein n=1 Tax=Candidatus Doudnabacteria bacterium RIFCSPHIGHO2_01_FULL_46_14 TaxID=1817824 RepID=A0A1F5NNQ0_9BACT|nr:MAG: hypothetical protein A2751_04680 [Candidatus Doudnabacteria bacterium RIFCSPHIGHO2_01_FULL_46_14]
MGGSYAATKRWRERYPKKDALLKASYYKRRSGSNLREGEPWLPIELALIRDPNKPSDPMISRMIARSIRAIQDMRSILKNGRRHW